MFWLILSTVNRWWASKYYREMILYALMKQGIRPPANGYSGCWWVSFCGAGGTFLLPPSWKTMKINGCNVRARQNGVGAFQNDIWTPRPWNCNLALYSLCLDFIASAAERTDQEQTPQIISPTTLGVITATLQGFPRHRNITSSAADVWKSDHQNIYPSL